MGRNLTRTNRPSSHYDGTSLKFRQILIEFLDFLSISIIRIVQFYDLCIFLLVKLFFIIHRMSSTNLWDYYRKDTINKNSYCLICGKSRCQQCKKQKNPCMLSGLFPTNAKKLLKHHHEQWRSQGGGGTFPPSRTGEGKRKNASNFKNFSPAAPIGTAGAMLY